ncbi:hypothetical protein GN958_ATG19496 [Phytophthora infestans]|uniref:Uncharacterized protein n=1 Tax=Phytophthora infestans TaxID=4787 RepID=A0A8S9TRH7_PHYIN|nr:hypothetical protein GN958_ATG19493 [Phytophthora infestans]KAF4131241.1 hypothetical protein GN958_ATG19496 [Phytophthora infestans]
MPMLSLNSTNPLVSEVRSSKCVLDLPSTANVVGPHPAPGSHSTIWVSWLQASLAVPVVLLGSVVVSSDTAAPNPTDIATTTTETVVPISSPDSIKPLVSVVRSFECVLEPLSVANVGDYNMYVSYVMNASYTMHSSYTIFLPFAMFSSHDLSELVAGITCRSGSVAGVRGGVEWHRGVEPVGHRDGYDGYRGADGLAELGDTVSVGGSI